ncbi:MAG: signal peptidase I [Anaerovoracaceae bacterium]|jgi:signal peptidase I
MSDYREEEKREAGISGAEEEPGAAETARAAALEAAEERAAVGNRVERLREKRERRRNVRSFIIDVLITFAIVFALISVVRPVIVSGESMEPNFQDRDYVFMNKMAYKNHEPERGDVIVFKVNEGTDEEELYIKRVIGVAGDTVSVNNGKVYLNGKAEDESYTKDRVTYGYFPQITVPENEVFVMGDNRNNSNDSRVIGTVDISRIEGKVVFRLFPLSRAGRITEYGP